MTELETRKVALDFAIKSAGEFRTNPDEIVATAEKFFAFLSGRDPETSEKRSEIREIQETGGQPSATDFGKADQTPVNSAAFRDAMRRDYGDIRFGSEETT